MRKGETVFVAGPIMSVASEFHAAEKFIEGLDSGERERLQVICARIQAAEETLWDHAGPLLEKCMAGCEGLCCRNINLADILAVGDFVYVLTVQPDLRQRAARCLANESAFSADCIFLESGRGPCIFTSHARPKVCIITFCFDDSSVKKEIRRVSAGFNKLDRFIWFSRARALMRYLMPKGSASSATNR
jgi:hypothetical protein